VDAKWGGGLPHRQPTRGSGERRELANEFGPFLFWPKASNFCGSINGEKTATLITRIGACGPMNNAALSPFCCKRVFILALASENLTLALTFASLFCKMYLLKHSCHFVIGYISSFWPVISHATNLWK